MSFLVSRFSLILLAIVFSASFDKVCFKLIPLRSIWNEHSVSKDKKIEVTALLKDGQSQRTVAEKVGIFQCCVGNVAKKLKVDAPLTNAPWPSSKATFN